jgi:hypothetical protein
MGSLINPSMMARDVTQWPFQWDSPWNLPVATTVTLQSAAASQTVNARSDPNGTTINSTSYSLPIYYATGATPNITVLWEDFITGTDYGTPSIPWSSDMTPAAGTDKNIVIVSADRQTAYEMWYVQGTYPSFTVGWYAAISLKGSGIDQEGVRAYEGSSIGGLVRQYDVNAGVIRHALALGVDTNKLYATCPANTGWVWPAFGQDDSACTTGQLYAGLNPMGTYCVIPQSVSAASLGITTPAGLMMYQAAKDYGLYFVDRTGLGTGYNTFYAEPNVSAAWITNLLSNFDLNRIVQNLRVVTNNTSTTPNGGTIDATGANRVQPLATPV